MSYPVIGITTRKTEVSKMKIPVVAAPRSYTEALIKAGAIPVLIPLNLPLERLQSLLTKLDGVIFTGGGDIDIARYNGEPHEKVDDICLERDEIELQLVKDVVEAEKPFLGICRGLQVVNVAHGGTLYTHVPDQVEGAVGHTYVEGDPFDKIAHPVQVDEDSRFAEIVGEPILQVNSLHHQGVKDLAVNLMPVAKAPDGLIEALELVDYPFGLAVQWHPEWLPDDARMGRIFEALVEAAGRSQANT